EQPARLPHQDLVASGHILDLDRRGAGHARARHARRLRAGDDAPAWRQRGVRVLIAGLTIPVELIVVPLHFDLRSVGLVNTSAASSPVSCRAPSKADRP